MKKYAHIVSLGHFCSVAIELNKIGLRNVSCPFDWTISDFEGVLSAIKSNFSHFIDYNNMAQSIKMHNVYRDELYNISFFHDFNQYQPLSKQIVKVQEKYKRRIKRFYKLITEPTLFIRYISDRKNGLGKLSELEYIENNYDSIISLIRSFNVNNDIIFIANNTVSSDIIDIYHVEPDKDDTVARMFLNKNEKLKTFLNALDFDGRQENINRYMTQEKKKNMKLRKMIKKLNNRVKAKLLQEYVHNKQY